jgi:hypothetical protein
MVICELARLGREAQVRHRRDLHVGAEGETVVPLVFGFVLDVEGEGFVLEVGEAEFGWEVLVAYAASLELSAFYDRRI